CGLNRVLLRLAAHLSLFVLGPSVRGGELATDGYVSRFFLYPEPQTADIYTLSLHDALPISQPADSLLHDSAEPLHSLGFYEHIRSEEHTSELQSREKLVCRLLLEKKNAGWACGGRRPPLRPAPGRGRAASRAGRPPRAPAAR